jgi:hypothetical protein
MNKYIELNLKIMQEYKLSSTEAILFEYLKNNTNGILNINKTIKDLPSIFKKKDTLYRCYKSLAKKKAINIYNLSYEECYNKLNIEKSSDGCVFCSSKNNLHNHHYPIKKSFGGTETIVLCSDCHFEFHSLSDYKHTYVILG